MIIFKKTINAYDKLLDVFATDLSKYFTKYFENNENLYCIKLYYDHELYAYRYYEIEYSDFWNLFEKQDVIKLFSVSARKAYNDKIEYDSIILQEISENVAILQHTLITRFKIREYEKELEVVHPDLFDELMYQDAFTICNKLGTIVYARGIGLIA